MMDCCDAMTLERAMGVSSKENEVSFMDFGDDDEDFDVDEARRKQDEEFDFGAVMNQASTDAKQKESLQGFVFF